jgi:hypothetical protein
MPNHMNEGQSNSSYDKIFINNLYNSYKKMNLLNDKIEFYIVFRLY